LPLEAPAIAMKKNELTVLRTVILFTAKDFKLYVVNKTADLGSFCQELYPNQKGGFLPQSLQKLSDIARV
jgi:hypothetical protein